MSELIEQLKRDAHLWQGREQVAPGRQGLATGYPALDQQLGGRGWPQGVLTEILLAAPGIGELRLLVPALRQLTAEGRTVVWVNPPYTPYAPALARAGIILEHLVIVRCRDHKDQLWALEQALRNPACALTMGWPGHLRPAAVRRLQLAAEAGTGSGMLFRPATSRNQSSPAHLRLLLSATPGSLNLEILKQRGSFAQPTLTLPLTPLTETLIAADQPTASPNLHLRSSSSSRSRSRSSKVIAGPWQPLAKPHPASSAPTGALTSSASTAPAGL